MPDILKMLVVDDNPNYRDLCESIGTRIDRNKYELYKAETPEQGLSLLEKYDPHVVILDIHFDPKNLDDSSGITDFLIPAREKGYEGAIICWSNDSGYRWAARKNGATDFVNKHEIETYKTNLFTVIDALIPEITTPLLP